MLDFDQTRGWKALEERLAATDNPRHRQLIQTVINHAKAEAVGDLDGLMDTLVADPQYHFWGPRGDSGPKGQDGVRAYYEAYINSGAAILQSPKERIIVDDWSICHEGVISTLLSWDLAKARGYAIPEDGGHYIVHMHVVILWTFDDNGRAFGEDSYGIINPHDFEAVAGEDLPAVYVDYLASIAANA
jgi:hypothetical protein